MNRFFYKIIDDIYGEDVCEKTEEDCKLDVVNQVIDDLRLDEDESIKCVAIKDSRGHRVDFTVSSGFRVSEVKTLGEGWFSCERKYLMQFE